MQLKRSVRGRETILNEADETILSLALKDAFPEIRFHSEATKGEETYRSLVSLCDGHQVLAKCPVHEIAGLSEQPTWPVPRRYLRFVRSTWAWGRGWRAANWAWDPPTLEHGCMDSSYYRDDDIARKFVNRAWRILARVATNRVKGGHPVGNILEGRTMVRMADESGGMTWCGHQALAWCREGGERRMLDGNTQPCDDWEIPKDPWYQDLVRRAMDTDGWHAKTLSGWREAG
jgi:hypothetical protein